MSHLFVLWREFINIPHLAAWERAPGDGRPGEDVAEETGEGEEDRDPGEADNGEQAVAEHGDHAGQAHPGHWHQVEEAVHGHAAQEPDPVNIVEVELPTEHDERAKSHGKHERARKVAITSYTRLKSKIRELKSTWDADSTYVCWPHGVEDGEGLLHDVVRVDAELLQQRRLVLEAAPGPARGLPEAGGGAGVWDEHLAGVVSLLAEVAAAPLLPLVIPSSTGAIVKLLEIMSLKQQC